MPNWHSNTYWTYTLATDSQLGSFLHWGHPKHRGKVRNNSQQVSGAAEHSTASQVAAEPNVCIFSPDRTPNAAGKMDTPSPLKQPCSSWERGEGAGSRPSSVDVATKP
ncbi:unnamed protein product [Polarella glacialis]|uniref:Uncharacterized protein n=1 Tax=Polarella glacialis TaxID=89957 RepID=A0A813GDP3_POLGL|nr:unnamed protein product [Polarella glacialis]CAE8622287.1 unnamed protein product [Polarella glacialis]